MSNRLYPGQVGWRWISVGGLQNCLKPPPGHGVLKVSVAPRVWLGTFAAHPPAFSAPGEGWEVVRLREVWVSMVPAHIPKPLQAEEGRASTGCDGLSRGKVGNRSWSYSFAPMMPSPSWTALGSEGGSKWTLLPPGLRTVFLHSQGGFLGPSASQLGLPGAPARV